MNLGKPLVVSFGTIGDPTWTRAVRVLEELQKKNKDKNLRVFGIVPERETDKVKAWMQKQKISFQIGMELQEKQGAALYGVATLPVTYVINRSRKVVDRIVGFDKEAEKKLRDAVAAAVK